MSLIRDVLDQLGGAASVADLLRLPYSTVGSWKARNTIPVEHWPAIIAAADSLQIEGITYESLALMHARKLPSPTEGASAS